MKRKTISQLSKWIVCLLVFTLVISSLPAYDWASTTATSDSVDQPASQEKAVSEGQDAARINQQIMENQPDIQAPPVEKTAPEVEEKQQEENIKVEQTGEGDYKKEIYLDPVQRKDEKSNEWKEISTDLQVNNQENTIEPANAGIDVAFEKQTNDGAYATVKDERNQVQYKLLGAQGDQPFTSSTDVSAEHKENQIFYRNVLQSVDLRNTVFDQSVKEDIILQKYEGFSQFKFLVKTSLLANLNEDGSISFKDEKSNVIFNIPRPYMSDSNVDKESGDPATSFDVYYELEKVAEGYNLNVVADKEWLTSSDRIYPVYIDPTITLGASDDTFVSSAYPTTNYDKFWESSSGYYSLKSGYYDSASGTNFAFVKPDTSKLQGALIDSAQFNVYTAHSYSSTPNNVWLDRVDGSWAPGTLTWNNKPASTNISTASVAKGDVASFNVLNTVKDWVSGSKPNYGFKLHENGNGQAYWKKFYASENSTNKPYLSVSYHYPTVSTPTGFAASNNNDTGYVNLSWNTVPGAIGYKIKLFNGINYEAFEIGNTTSWTSKGKGIWPTQDEIESGEYELHHDGKGTELSRTPGDVYGNADVKYENSRTYFFRVSAVFPGGESSNSDAFMPILPLDQPVAKPYANTTSEDTGYVTLSWDEDENPKVQGYKVWMYNGKNYEMVSTVAKGTSTWTTQGKGIWPTQDEIKAGQYQLHTDGNGVELARDPSAVYKNSGGIYPTNTNYWFRVTAYGTDGESALSNPTTPKIPSLESSYLGMEEFWSSFEVPGGTVNAFNGNFLFDETDFSLDGKGPGINIFRTFNSKDTGEGLFGKGWQSTLDLKVLEDKNGDVLYIQSDKRIQRYKKISTGYEAPTGIYVTLTKDSNGYYFKDTDQSLTAFNANGTISYEKDANGNQTSYNYTNGKLTSITDATDGTGRTVTFGYDGAYISSITYADQVTTFKYDNGQLKETTTPEGRLYKYDYKDGMLYRVYDPRHTDASPSFTEYEYDADSRLVTAISPLKKKTSIAYDTDKREVTVTNPSGSKDIYRYNEDGNPSETVDDADNLKLTTTFKYENNNLVQQIDPRDQGKRISEDYKYDANGNVTSATDAFGTETYEYNKNNDVTKATDTENRATTISYDDTNAVSEVDTTAKTASMSTYDKYGNVIESSGDLSTANNLINNSGFEKSLGSEWASLSKNDSGSFSIADNHAPGSFSGSKVLQVKPNRSVSTTDGQQGFIAATQVLNVQPNASYTLSALIKAESLENASAFLNVEILDVNGKHLNWASNRFNQVTGNSKWKERQVSFSTDTQGAKVRIFLEVEHLKGPVNGVALFDNLQLEDGPVSSSFNPIVNSGFENDANGWAKSAGTSVASVANEGFSGAKSISIQRQGTGDTETSYSQEVVLNQSTPRNITLTGMSKADGVAGPEFNSTESKDYSIWADVTFGDGSKKVYQAKFTKGTHDWSRSAVTIDADDLNKAIQKVRVYTIFRNKFTGTAYFDDIRLLEDNHLTQNSYDSNGNYLTKVTDEKGRTQQFQYDAYGNKTSEIDPKGQEKNSTYNKDNQLTSVSLKNGTSVKYGYDKNGNVNKKEVVAEGNTQTISYDYDLDNKLGTYTDPLGFITKHQYDDNGNKTKTNLPNNHTLEWTYDTADRTTSEKRDGVTAFTFEYDPNGNETKVVDSINSVVRIKDYDKANQIVSMTDRGGTFAWTYKPNSTKVTKSTFTQNGLTNETNYEYNNLDQNISVKDAQGKAYRFDYDENGNVRTYTAGNAAGSDFTYDVTGKVTGLEIGNANSDTILSESYKYDENDNRKEITSYKEDGSVDSKTSYDYDSLDQLVKEILPDGTIKEYVYNGFGNRTSVKVTEPGKSLVETKASFNIGNQLTSFGDESIKYDENGNRIEDGKYIYKWNAADQLVSITVKGKSIPFVTYKYDDDDRRIEKNVNDKITRYYYDGDSINPLYETDENGTILRSYVYSIDGLRLSMKTGGQTYFYHYNPHGDVVAMTDDNGNVVVSYRYDAWGNAQKQVISGQVDIQNPFTYAGYMQDDETGFYYLIARYYNPEQGVFLSADPDPGDEDDPVTQNGYSYANNNPVMHVDPNGRFALEIYFIPGVGQVALLATIAVVGGYGAWRLGRKLSVLRARSKPSGGDPAAHGRPHTRYKRKNGRVSEYTTYGNGGVVRKQFRGEGKAHGNVSRPNVKSQNYYNRNPKNKKRYKKTRVRKPYRKEYPRGYR